MTVEHLEALRAVGPAKDSAVIPVEGPVDSDEGWAEDQVHPSSVVAIVAR